jgi:hypothetical protein
MEGELLLVLPWMFIAFGLLIAAVSIWLIQRAMRGRHWPEIEGLVIDYHSRAGGSGTLYAPEIEYRLPGRPPVQLIDSLASSVPPTIGMMVRLRYNPDDHAEVMVWAPLSRGLLYAFLLVMGLIFIGAGIFTLQIR